MSLLDTIRKKSNAEKMRLLWIVVILAAALLVAAWILTAQISRTGPKDTTLFQTISQGLQNVKNNYKK